MDRKGECLCGAVRFTAKEVSDVSACHCGMCRRWAGGPWLGADAKSIDWERDEAVRVIKSSDWAERGFCEKCGSGLFYRVTAPGKFHGLISVSVGTFEDQSGMAMTKEWFIDKKPELYSFEGDRQKVTTEEVEAMFASATE